MPRLQELLDAVTSEESKDLLSDLLGQNSELAGQAKKLASFARRTAHAALNELIDQNYPLVDPDDLRRVILSWDYHDTDVTQFRDTNRTLSIQEGGMSVEVSVTGLEGGGSRVKIDASPDSASLMHTVVSLISNAAYQFEVREQAELQKKEMAQRDAEQRERTNRE